jgi:hypothetical protein
VLKKIKKKVELEEEERQGFLVLILRLCSELRLRLMIYPWISRCLEVNRNGRWEVESDEGKKKKKV